MPTVFDALFASTGLPILYQNFGEPVIYLVNGGLQVQLTAIISPDEGQETEVSKQILNMDIIRVRIGRTTGQVVAGKVVGGISMPKLLDNLVRLDDPNQRPFSFLAPISRNENTQLLRFQRGRVERLGTGNQTK